MNFAELGLNEAVLRALTDAGYVHPTAVQREAIPAALAGHDLLVSSHTGSGKTAAFLLPALVRLGSPAAAQSRGPRVLVLTPTRELALQVEKAARTYGRHLPALRTVALVGGVPYGLQLKALSGPLDIVIATPGRLMDHMERGRVDFSRLQTLVLDEADRMLDMGFINDIDAIVAKTPVTRQTLLFSATLDGVVGKLARRLTRQPHRIEIATADGTRADIEQRLMYADNSQHKMRLLTHLIQDDALTQAVVFTGTKRGAEALSAALADQGVPSAALHGDMQQRQRNRTLDDLRRGITRVLVATDVAARGIDVAGISHVINFDAPRQAEDYVHRIGRTGRAGRSGIAITFATREEQRMIREIERFTGKHLTPTTIPGLEPRPQPDSPPRPHPAGRGKGSGPRKWEAKGQGAPRGTSPGRRSNEGATRTGGTSASRSMTGFNRDTAKQPAARQLTGFGRTPADGFADDRARSRSGPRAQAYTRHGEGRSRRGGRSQSF